MSDDAVFAATGHAWAHWKAHLDAAGAGDMTHAEIASLLKNEGVKPWWRQMITVGYERMIGRREVGQTCAGDFAASASRTVSGDKDSVLQQWEALNAERAEFAGAFVTSEPRKTSSEKWNYWRVELDNGSRVSVHISDKANGKATIGVNHNKLADADGATEAKAWWKGLLAEIST